jgi:TatD DNase family protein
LPPLCDTHCHLDLEQFDADRPEVIRRAIENGVTRILDPGIDLAASRKAVELAAHYQQVYAAVGVHPNESSSWNDKDLDEISALGRMPRVLAIGEIGLDYYRQRAPVELQKNAFRAQLAAAASLKLPVIVHSRQSMADVLSELEIWYNRLAKEGSSLAARPGVMHAFEGSLEDARRAFEMHFYIGVGGPVTYHNAAERQALVSAAPLEQILLETDAPFLTPHPHRGERNEPAFTIFTASKIAELKSLPLSTIAGITSANAARLFHWGDGD